MASRRGGRTSRRGGGPWRCDPWLGGRPLVPEDPPEWPGVGCTGLFGVPTVVVCVLQGLLHGETCAPRASAGGPAGARPGPVMPSRTDKGLPRCLIAAEWQPTTVAASTRSTAVATAP